MKLICDMTSDCLQQFNLSIAWNQKEKTQQSFVVQEVVWGLRKQSIEHETFSQAFDSSVTPIRSCKAESIDDRPRYVQWEYSLYLFCMSVDV